MTRLFADDSSLFYAAANIADIAGIIIHDLQLLSNWASLVTNNQLKIEAVLFTLKKLEFLPHLIVDNTAISFVDSHKHLVVTSRSNGQCYTHIRNIVNSATKTLGIMSKLKLKYSINRNSLNRMYMSYLLPLVEYASVVWFGCPEQDSQTLKEI